MSKIAYVNNTGADVRPFEAAILAAIANGGTFGVDLADIFALRCPCGVWLLEWA